MKPINFVYYAIALIFPVVLFVGILHNANERNPIAVYALCIALFGIAGWLSGPPNGKGTWALWSIFVGAIEATILVFAA